jgi:hypothetical protein
VQNNATSGPRVHLDLHTDNVPGLVERARSLGATDIPGGDVPVFASPGGLVFCAVEHVGEREVPTSVQWTSGQRSVVDQVCLDIPPSRYDAELAFWSALTGWERHDPDPDDEFERLSGVGALQVLAQRLDSEAPAVTAHLDLRTDGVGFEVERHLALGATHMRDGRGWVTLADPSGLAYCVTGRTPS